MASTTSPLAFAEHVVDAMRGFGPVEARRMFGGHGLYHQGVMFALIVQGRLYFKVDEHTRPAFVARGLAPFTYEAQGKRRSVAYHEAPPEVFDDPGAMAACARQAHECAARQQARGGKRANPSPSGGQPPSPKGELASLRNLGARSQEMLAKAGIHTEQDLAEVGAVMAYVRTKAVWPQASLNLLWALEGALQGRAWQEVAAHDRASLLMALEDVQRSLQGGGPEGGRQGRGKAA